MDYKHWGKTPGYPESVFKSKGSDDLVKGWGEMNHQLAKRGWQSQGSGSSGSDREVDWAHKDHPGHMISVHRDSGVWHHGAKVSDFHFTGTGASSISDHLDSGGWKKDWSKQ